MEVRSNRTGLSVELPMENNYGSRRFEQQYNLRTLTFPRSWQVEPFEPDNVGEMRPLSGDEVREGLRRGIGSEPLRKLAEGRKDAAIIVDDLSRPTPAYAVMPHILEELRAGGLDEGKVRIVIGLGTHRPISKAERQRKLGKETVERIEVINHNAWGRNTRTYSRPDGIEFKINSVVGDADLKIAVSGILSHGGAGFGGGAKAVLPSVASYDTIQYNHTTYAWEAYGTVYPEKIQSACIRRDMELCAGIVGLDYSINLVYSPLKEILGVFSGDFIKAHRAGCKVGRDLYLTRVTSEKLDVVIANGYPMDSDIGQSHRGIWPEKYGRKGVLMGGARDGWAFHGDNGKSYRTYRRLKRQQKQTEAYRFRGTPQRDDDAGYYYSPVLSEETFYERDAKRRFFNRWEDLIAALDDGRKVKTVGVFPYAAMQVEGTP